MTHAIDQKLAATPPAVLERNKALQAALNGEVTPTVESSEEVQKVAARKPPLRAVGGSASDLGRVETPQSWDPDTRPKEKFRPAPVEQRTLYELIKEQVDAMDEFDVVIETADMDFIIHAASVTLQEHGVSMILKEGKAEMKPKFGHTYTLRVLGKVMEVIFAGGFLKDPKLPFTVLSFIINKDE